jgi:hypothetical protein
MEKTRINKIVVHSSGTSYGNAIFIDRLHSNYGRRKMIDYNYVILNGRTTANKENYQKWIDGNVETGAPIGSGTHKDDSNDRNSIKICIIGEGDDFTIAQFIALRTLVRALENKYDLSHSQVIGHNELDNESNSSCPGTDMDNFRCFLEDKNKVTLLGRGNCGCTKKVRHG